MPLTNFLRPCFAFALLSSAVLSLAGCGGRDLSAEGEAGPEGPIPSVEALPARSGSLPLEERLSGVVKAQNQVAIRPEISASVAEVRVRSGESVRRGQPLVRLAEDTLRDQLRQAEASVTLAEAQARESRARVAELEAQVRRTRALAEEELVSRMQLETQEAQLEAVEASAAQAQARVEQSRATLEERRTAISKAVIRAPVTGRVGQRNAEVGMLVNPNTLLFLIGNLDQVRVEIPLTESMLGFIDEGMEVQVTSEALESDEPIRAELSRISPFLEEGSFSTIGEIDIDNRDGRLRPGMFVTVDVFYGQSEDATLVPAASLWEDPRTGVLGVFVVREMQGVEPVEPPDSDTAQEGFETRRDTPQVVGAGSPEKTPKNAPKDVPETVHPAELLPVQVLAEGRGSVGVRGIEAGDWVVTSGQQLLAGLESPAARVRPVSWQRVFELQGLQREDLLRGFLDRQRRSARERGASIPGISEYLSGESEIAPDETPDDTSRTQP